MTTLQLDRDRSPTIRISGRRRLVRVLSRPGWAVMWSGRRVAGPGVRF
jgi:hypothetical protein